MKGGQSGSVFIKQDGNISEPCCPNKELQNMSSSISLFSSYLSYMYTYVCIFPLHPNPASPFISTAHMPFGVFFLVFSLTNGGS